MTDGFRRWSSFATDVDGITSIDALTVRAEQALATFGVTSLSANLIKSRNRMVRPGILFGRNWRAWSGYYQSHRLEMDDPALRMLNSRSRPFTWSEAVQQFPSAAAIRVVDACLDFTSCREGLVVPVHETDGALLTAAFCGEALDTSPEARSVMLSIGYAYVTRGRELTQGIRFNPLCPLTPRQLACLDWVQKGKTDQEIGLILGISPRTVHNHVEAAKRVLGLTKRAQAAAEAWRMGWLA